MEPDKKKIAADCWKKATEAMAKENWDYAVAMFSKAVAIVPDNVAYRQHLRGAEYKRYKDNKKGASLASMRLMPIRGKITKARMQKNWESLDRLAEEGLAMNPWDAQLNADMGEACSHLYYQEAAIFGYEKALSVDPDNKEWNRALARLLEERGNYSRAIERWKHIYKIDPLDSEARSKMTQLEATSVLEHRGYEKAATTRDVQSAYDYDRLVKQEVPDAVDGPGVSVEADLQHAIRKAPENKDNYLKLAQLYRNEKRLDEAAEMLQKAFEVTGGDPNVGEQLEDVQLEQLRHNVDLALSAMQKNPDDGQVRQNLQALRKELLQREMEILSARVERYPKDNRMKFELARRRMKVKQWDKAIPLLQRAAADVRLESEVLVALGKCFVAVNNRKLARGQFEKAIPKINAHEKPELFTEAHYILARLYEDTGDREAAENHYNEILAVDYDYKDARQRFEKLQQAAGDAK